MKRIAIIGAMPQEVEILTGLLDALQQEQHAGMTFHAGQRHGLDICVLQSGIGKVNAAVGTALLLERFRPDAVVNTGSAGGFARDMAIGDVVVSDQVFHHDVDACAFGYAPGQVPGMPATFGADERLRAEAKKAVHALGDVQVKEGSIATGDCFMSDPARIQAVRQTFPDMLAVDMEAAAIAQTCHLMHCPFVVIRALSDLPDSGDNHLSFDEFLPLAARHSSRLVDQLLRQLGDLDQARH